MSDFNIHLTRRRLLSAGGAAICWAGSTAAFSQGRSGLGRHGKKILLVSTNVNSILGKRSGTFLKEIAFPFKILNDYGYELDVVTPKGGRAAIYHSGTISNALAEIQSDVRFIQKVENTLTPESVRAGDYAAIFYPGGHGQYWDVLDNAAIANACAAICEAGGVIGTAGHGAVSLLNVRLANGQTLSNGVRMTCFPWWAEKEWMDISDFGKVLPFNMEEIFRRQGADLVLCTPETQNDLNLTVITDTKRRVVTGSFAKSAPNVAEKMHQHISLMAG